ncbi:MAG: hypothetical protein JWM64_2590, partial [Frankiales bacterium]|nr:hypothetical protein [Frankiales bacterium]
ALGAGGLAAGLAALALAVRRRREEGVGRGSDLPDERVAALVGAADRPVA